MIEKCLYNAPFGNLLIEASSSHLMSISFHPQKEKLTTRPSQVLKFCCYELDQYFLGKLKKFETPIYLDGTEFQKKSWNALRQIPYGKTWSYKDQASYFATAKHTRAVAMANNKNKLPIIIPCHRVIGSDNKLVGYNGGLEIKKYLLNLEEKFR